MQEDHEPVMPEEQLLGGSLAEQLAADDAVQQQAMEEMRDRVSKLEREMVSQALKGLASDSKVSGHCMALPGHSLPACGHDQFAGCRLLPVLQHHRCLHGSGWAVPMS